MADSSITKKALASALKNIMETVAYQKISVGDICSRCRMNRKSFYYHFRDKEDLVNWIFDTEFALASEEGTHGTDEKSARSLIYYFYENRSFYRKVLVIEGQNSLSEHLSELCYPMISEWLCKAMDTSTASPLQVGFFADGIICCLKRWLTSSECIAPEEFISQMQNSVHMAARRICATLDADTEAKK